MMLRADEDTRAIAVEAIADGYRLTMDDESSVARGRCDADGSFDVELGQARVRGSVVIDGPRRHVFHAGRAWAFTLVDVLEIRGVSDEAEGGLKAPMPGKVIALIAATGAVVEKGSPLLVLEAMKMEHTITAPARGTVRAFHYAPGDQVDEGADLVEFVVVP
jgi:3-methylcrotonyl-CoA carboxylase alpha subunit